MARLAVVVDRAPGDLEWKGSFVWDIILSLAEAQHEVLALSPSSIGVIEVSHPRLNVAQPAKSFSVRYFGRWFRALFQFQPDVIHTFALKPATGRFAELKTNALTVWPMLEGAFKVMPRMRKFSTAFSIEDFAPFERIHAPLDLPAENSVASTAERSTGPGTSGATNTVIIPAAVSEWRSPIESMLLLNEFLLSSKEMHAHIVGGWGDTPLSERRAGWKTLENVNQQVHMGDPVDLPGLMTLARGSAGVWLRSLRIDSWSALVAAHLAQKFSLPTWGEVPALNAGSTANYLSRLYTGTLPGRN